LSARVVNPTGGNTEFADMRAAYDALDDDTKAEIEDMICEHSLMYSRGSLGFLDYTDEEKAMFKPVLQRLVRTHRCTAANRCICHRMPAPSRHEHAGGAAFAARSHRARHAAGIRLRPQMDVA
jgi:alpha-ketoglutarate-dependent taurine dioxygenase